MSNFKAKDVVKGVGIGNGKNPSEIPTSSSSAAPGQDSADPDGNTRIYSVRVPKVNSSKQNNLMRFNGALKVDIGKWTNVKMIREDNSALHKLPDWGAGNAEMPKFGAGSEFGREQREEARRRKYGNAKKYKPEDQPWILKLGSGETAKKFKGVREGGVNDNASYFIFTQAANGTFEVFPIKEWFNFTPIQRYKSLTAEEAEEQFSKRNKIMNLFSVMVHKRLKDDKEEADEDGRGDKKSREREKREKADMKVSDMDDWIMEEDEEESDSDEEGGNKKEKNAKKAKGKPKKKNKKDESDEDPMEDSDDGDEEGREQDYMTDVSSSDEDEEEKKPDLQGVDQDDALRALLESESSSDEDEEAKSEEKKEEEPLEGEKKKKSKKKKKKHDSKDEAKNTSSDVPMLANESPEVVGDDGVDNKPDPGLVDVKAETPSMVKEEGNPGKRKAVDYDLIGNSSKKHKVEVPASTLQLAASEGITEEAVRKYLQRKPMTIAELLQKFKPKKSKISSNDLVPVIAHILKKLNPTKRNQQNKMYFFINPQ